MSLTVTTDVFCDLCNSWVHGVSGRDYKDAKNARKCAKIEGWITKYKDRKLIDVCPGCQIKNPRDCKRIVDCNIPYCFGKDCEDYF